MSTSGLRELLFLEDADTLAVIDLPSRAPAGFLHPSCALSIGHRIHSWKLLETGSPFFHRQFDQKTQERNIKRRGGLPDGIKYIIDLSPATTDEEGLLTIAELSCPLGLRTWADAQVRWSLPTSLVSGFETPGDEKDENGYLAEYSPDRHRAGIVHILRVIENLNVELDTPCKLWTFFAVAKLYEIATMPDVSVRVASWVYEDNNRRLIEVHPEITYRLGKGIECAHLMQDSYCVLAGEEALLLLHDSGAPTPNKAKVTVHERVRESLDDDDEDRIQYAGKSLLAHVIEQFVELAGNEMLWLHESTEIQKVLSRETQTQHALEIKHDLISTLKDFVRTSIISVLTQQWKASFPTDTCQSKTYPRNDVLHVYNNLSLTQRLMTRTFWTRLRDKRLTENAGSGEAEVLQGTSLPWGTSLASLGGNIGAFRDQHDAIIRRVRMTELWEKASAFNCLVNSILPQEHQKKYFGGGDAYGQEGAFTVALFVDEADHLMRQFVKRMCAPRREGMEYNFTDTLTGLTEKQYRFLPLWAGGCDDGTGGVYADQVPFAEAGGFSTPGPSIHTGSAAPSTAPSITSFLESTVHGASHRATEGASSEVISLDSEVMSEADAASEFELVDEELSLALDSSADDFDDDAFDDSDSDDTVVLDHGHIGDLGEFEELSLDDRVVKLPIRGKKDAT
ncbi:uncharacterized protein DSM5745_07998 [Aspergillus mulundensis]|uniref:Uncharacterized protein n=1 Tax=Aspergillus mulundensis TaxID=1810919 RepID=A0A3D8R8V6_9EURO|nr:Uncharacterized protein DSM5745_07998 [Aspergillus mulundensis]RDW70487.1 Uncharacterized protein DSM5745_07998 [Aspergillus mulundensis]